jgi:DNA-binding MarR family transcriptional regulator
MWLDTVGPCSSDRTRPVDPYVVRVLTTCQRSDMERRNPHHTESGAALTQVVLTVFRANGALVAAGEKLARELSLTSARWQVLGAVELAERPLTVPQIARRMGLARQSVHATVRALVDLDLLRLAPNTEHQRSALVTSTPEGQQMYRSLEVRQAAWINALANGFNEADLRVAGNVLDTLVRQLDQPPQTTSRGEQEVSHVRTPI